MLYHYFNKNVLENVGDYFVLQGAKFLTRSFNENFLVGEPWLWDNCESSVKYDWLRENQSKFKIAIGIGASIPLGYDDLLYKDKTLKECEKIWKRFKLVIVRDEIACDFFQKIGVNVKLLPCPSIFLQKTIPFIRKNLFTCTVNISENEHKKYFSYVEKLPEIKESMFNINIDNNWNDLQIKEYISFMGKCSRIISMRIHQVIPFCNGKECSILPIDSRYRTAVLFGIPVYPEIKRINVNEEKIYADYMDILKSVL